MTEPSRAHEPSTVITHDPPYVPHHKPPPIPMDAKPAKGWRWWPWWKKGLVLIGGAVWVLVAVVVLAAIADHKPRPVPKETTADIIAQPAQEYPTASWMPALAEAAYAGPLKQKRRCHKETYHVECALNLGGLSDASVSFIRDTPGAWSAFVAPTDSGDLMPGRFGEAIKLCDRPGLNGYGSSYYFLTGPPMAGNYVQIQRTPDRPSGSQAFVKSPQYLRVAPSQFHGKDWEECARLAGHPIVQ